MTKEILLNKIADKTAIVGVIGMGYVGLPLVLEFAQKEFEVVGFDVDKKKILMLNNGQSYIKHISSEKIKNAVDNKKFKATSNFSLISSCDAIIICVPTPLDAHREPDMTYIINTAKTVQKYLRKGQLITLESTTYPGTTEEILLPMFEKAPEVQAANIEAQTTDKSFTSENSHFVEKEHARQSFNAGEDFFLAFSPEREDPNNPDYNTATIPKVVGGVTKSCVEIACALYNNVIIKTVPVSSPKVAEATKLLENIYRSINIALVNELKMVFNRMDIDIWEVIEAAKTKPFGFNAFYPGPGLGGHCIPIDPFYLTWKAREYGINTKFIELAGEINTYQPYYVVERAVEILNDKKKALKDSKILILGMAYKKNVDDIRESPSLKLVEILRDKGAEVDYSDPYIPKLPPTRKYQYDMESVELTKENLKKYDLVLLSTNHDNFDYEVIVENASLILDTRNTFAEKSQSNNKIYKA